MLVSSFGCSYETADIEFEYTLSQALQKGNNLAFHLIQSFAVSYTHLFLSSVSVARSLADEHTR